MARRNGYPGRCAKCQRQVAAQDGWLEGPPWRVVCNGCSPAADRVAAEPQGAPSVRIDARPAQGDLTIRAASFLGGEHFERFRGIASDVAQYDPECRANLAPRDRLLECMRAFREGGFQVVLAPELVAELHAEADEAKKTSAVASARLEVLRGRFKLRHKTLRVYQETGFAFLAESTTGALLADDPGTGKTIMCLASWEDEPAVLVVCPVNAIGVWTREIQAWRPELSVSRCDSSITVWPRKGQVLLATYDAMRKSGETVKVDVEGEEVEFTKLLIPGTPEKGTVVVADEGHRLAKPTSARRKTWSAIVAAVAAKLGGGFLLTGSPVLNVEKDLWSLLEACGSAGSAVFGTKKAFLKLARGGETTKEEYVRKVRRVMLRRTKKEVMKELPPIQWTTIDVQIDASTRAQLDALLAKVVANAVEVKLEAARQENARSEKANAALEDPDAARLPIVDLDELRRAVESDVQAAIDLAFDGRIKIPFELISRVKALLAAAKLPTALEVLDDLEGLEDDRAQPGELFSGFVCDDPICFASAHVEPVEAVARRPGWALIRGGVSAEKRTQIVEKFQAGGYRGVALAIKAAGEALTLTRSSRMLINDPEWTPAAMDQLVSRIHRMGQQGRQDAEAAEPGAHVQVIRLVAAHVLDRRIQEILDIKLGIVERVVEAAAVGVEHRAVSAAVEIEAALAATTVGARPEGKRAPLVDAERAVAAVLLGPDPLPTTFLSQMRLALRRDGALSEKQWEYATKAVKGAYVVRPAKDDVERWAAAGLARLAAADPDRAGELNNVGFNRFDGERGHAVAERLARGDTLSDDDWRTAVRLCDKYQRQVGPRPWVPLEEVAEDPPAAPPEPARPRPVDLAAEHALNPFLDAPAGGGL